MFKKNSNSDKNLSNYGVSAITVRRIKDSDQLAVVAAGLNKFWSEILFYRCNMSSKYWVKRVWSPSAVRERHHGART